MAEGQPVGFPLSIRMLGPFEVCVGGRPLPRLRSRKDLYLLALLALNHNRPVEREWLAGILWPDSPEDSALAALRKSLYLLRRALGQESARLHAPSPRTLQLDTRQAFLDIERFDRAVGTADGKVLDAALAVYRGPLLEGWLEDWILSERETREQTYLRALDDQAESAADSGDLNTAVQHLQRAIRSDPLNERRQRRLMQLLADSGRLAEASQSFRDFRKRLRAELDVDPDLETTELHSRLKAETRSRSVSRTALPRSGQGSACGNLPSPLIRLIGREDDVRQVRAMVSEARLLTLTGAGGVGKTSLAIEVAHILAPSFADGAWFVDLAGLMDGCLIPSRMAEALGVQEQPGEPVDRTLANRLKSQELLLVLDNCEHIIEPSARYADYLLRSAKGLRIMATSRQPLGIAGEVTWRVPSLKAPNESELISMEDMPAYPAMRLFEERARAANCEFELAAHNLNMVAVICQRLDGIPLALEMAAACTGAMTVSDIASRLANRLGLLTEGSAAAPPRQQTLRATLEWSFGLLCPRERRLLTRLSAFAGGWNLASAETVCAGGGLESEAILSLMRQLVCKNLVVFDERGGGRYRLLETVKEFAAEQLTRSGESVCIQNRHLQYWREFAESTVPYLRDVDHSSWFDGLEPDHDNLRAVLDWSLACENRTEEGLRLAVCLAIFWLFRGHLTEGRVRLEILLDRSPGASTLLRGRASVFLEWISFFQGDFAALERYFEDALQLARRAGDEFTTAIGLNVRAMAALDKGDYTLAEDLCSESLALARRLESRWLTYFALNVLGGAAYRVDDLDRADSLLKESIDVAWQMSESLGAAYSIYLRGEIARSRGRLEESSKLHAESLSLFCQTGDRRGMASCLEAFGTLAVAVERADRAATLFGAAQELRESIGALTGSYGRRDIADFAAAAETALGSEPFHVHWRAGRAMTLEQMVDLALSRPA